MANRAIVYAIYPNSIQGEQCQKTFGCCRFVYNQMLTVQRDRRVAGEKHLSKMSANTYCNQHLKTMYPFLREVDKFALTNAVYHLSDGYDRFFKRLGGFPKYKSKHKSKRSYTTNYTNGNIKIGDDYIQLPKLGRVRAKVHRKPDSGWKIKSAVITQNRDDSYQVSVLFEYDEPVCNYVPDIDNAVGLDYKSNGLYTDNNGHCCSMPHFFRLSQKRLAKAQRKLKHKTVGSHNYRKQQRRIAKVYRHAANQRKDFLHKTSTAITKRYDVVCVESLNMRALSNKSFGNGKSTMDNGYGMFLDMLEYKMKDRNKYLIKVDKWFKSSQICHRCGTVHPEMKDLDMRTMRCSCGLIIDRDYNAAINIWSEGLRILRSK